MADCRLGTVPCPAQSVDDHRRRTRCLSGRRRLDPVRGARLYRRQRAAPVPRGTARGRSGAAACRTTGVAAGRWGPHSGARTRQPRRSACEGRPPSRARGCRHSPTVRRRDGCRNRAGTSSRSQAPRPMSPRKAPSGVPESRTSGCARHPSGHSDASAIPRRRGRSRSIRTDGSPPSSRCSTAASRERRRDTRRTRTAVRAATRHNGRRCRRTSATRAGDIAPTARYPFGRRVVRADHRSNASNRAELKVCGNDGASRSRARLRSPARTGVDPRSVLSDASPRNTASSASSPAGPESSATRYSPGPSVLAEATGVSI